MRLRGFSVLLFLALAPASALAENLSFADIRMDKAEGQSYVLFCMRPAKGAAKSTDAFVAVGVGESQASLRIEGAYGMSTRDGERIVGSLSAKTVRRLRNSTEDPALQTFVVQVDEKLKADVSARMEQWAAKTEFLLGADSTALDFTAEVVKSLPLKEPYRSMLSGGSTHGYYGDLVKINAEKS